MSLRRWSHKQLKERWAKTMAAYRLRQRQWVMEAMPTMPEAQWKKYERWVAEFGADTLTQTGKNTRKVRRQLKHAKKQAMALAELRAKKDWVHPAHVRLYQQGADYGVRDRFHVLAVQGAKVPRRATRR